MTITRGAVMACAVLGVMLSSLAGCCFSPTPAPSPAPVVVTPPVIAPPAPVAPPGAACLVGRWRATEIMALIERDLRRGLRNSEVRLVGSSGALAIEVAPVEATSGKGVMTVRADALVYRLAGATQGVSINATTTMTGTAQMPYTTDGAMGLTIERATEGSIRARTNARVAGFGVSQNSNANIDLNGTYTFACSPTELIVTKPGGRAVTFTRE